jgi:hypothetical protein
MQRVGHGIALAAGAVGHQMARADNPRAARDVDLIGQELDHKH